MSYRNPHIRDVVPNRAQTESEKNALRLLQRLSAYTGQLNPSGEDVRLAETMIAAHGLDVCLNAIVFAFDKDEPRDGIRFWTKKIIDAASLAKALEGDLLRQTIGYAQSQRLKTTPPLGEMVGKEFMQDSSRFTTPEVRVVEDGYQYDDTVGPYSPTVTDLLAAPCSDPNCSHEKSAFQNGNSGCPQYFAIKDATSKRYRSRLSPSFQKKMRLELRKLRETCDVCQNRLWVLKRFPDGSILVRDCPECLMNLNEVFIRLGYRQRPKNEPKPATERSFTANADADIEAIRP
jgi:hypothetical protein